MPRVNIGSGNGLVPSGCMEAKYTKDVISRILIVLGQSFSM